MSWRVGRVAMSSVGPFTWSCARGAECLTKQLTNGRSGTQARQWFRLLVGAAPLGHEARTSPVFFSGRPQPGWRIARRMWRLAQSALGDSRPRPPWCQRAR